MIKGMDSPTLFDLTRHTDPETSRRAAAKLVKSGRHKSQKQRVLEALRRLPNSTSAELAAYSGLDRFMVARRLPDLARDGKVMQCEERICRVTGTPCVTWFAISQNSS